MKTVSATREGTAPPPHRKLAGTVLYLLLGPIVWAGHLTIIYGTHAVLCVRGLADGPFDTQVIIAGATGVALAGTTAAAFIGWRRQRGAGQDTEGVSGFQHGVMSLLALLAAIGIAFFGATPLFVPPCLQLR